jgi:hypothetical protein
MKPHQSILSIDVGIKNLAYCIFSNGKGGYGDGGGPEMGVEAWGILNLMESSFSSSSATSSASILTCNWKNKKGKVCSHLAKFQKPSETQYYLFCLAHAKKSPYLVPNNKQYKNLAKKTLPELEAFLIENGHSLPLNLPSRGKKAELVKLAEQFVKEKVLEPIPTSPIKKAGELPLPEIGKNLQQQLDTLLDIRKNYHILIENQIGAGPMVNKMKTLQGMLTQYFVMQFPQSEIHYLPSRHKLNLAEVPIDSKKNTYDERKKLGIATIQHCFLTNPIYASWKPVFESHSKKDDLSDAFLQGIWFLRNPIHHRLHGQPNDEK